MGTYETQVDNISKAFESVYTSGLGLEPFKMIQRQLMAHQLWLFFGGGGR